MRYTDFTSKRRSHVRRLGIVLAATLLVAGSICTYTYQRSIAARNITPVAGQIASLEMPWPDYGSAAIGALGSGVLATHGDQKPRPTASVAKVMTALAILKVKPLATGESGPTITITQQDQDLYDYYKVRDGSLSAVKVGEKITEYDALEALLLPSSNNMADTLANWAFGSMEAYSDYANDLARSLGMTQSDFADASGYSPRTVSTPADLIRLGEAALQHPVIAEIVAKQSAKIPVAGTVKNTNSLLGGNSINGIKTGNTDQAGGVFLGSRTAVLPNGQTIQLISVVMGAPDTKTALRDSVPLLNDSAQNFSPNADSTPARERRHDEDRSDPDTRT